MLFVIIVLPLDLRLLGKAYMLLWIATQCSPFFACLSVWGWDKISVETYAVELSRALGWASVQQTSSNQ